MKIIEGWLYGHYDSRGGATLIAANKAEADEWYCNDFSLEEVFQGDELTEAKKDLLDADFLGAARLVSPEQPKNGEDIEYRDEEDPMKLWVRFFPDEQANAGFQGAPGRYELIVAPKQPDGFEESELGEDAFGVIFQDKKEW